MQVNPDVNTYWLSHRLWKFYFYTLKVLVFKLGLSLLFLFLLCPETGTTQFHLLESFYALKVLLYTYLTFEHCHGFELATLKLKLLNAQWSSTCKHVLSTMLPTPIKNEKITYLFLHVCFYYQQKIVDYWIYLRFIFLIHKEKKRKKWKQWNGEQ